MDQPNYSTQPPVTDLFTDEPVVYGTFWERFAAAFIDGLILGVANFIIGIAIEGLAGSAISIVLGWLYAALQESSPARATLGKRAMGLQVTSLAGAQISFAQATGRYFAKILSGLILLIGYLMMLWDEKKQTLHDKLAGTLVVKK